APTHFRALSAEGGRQSHSRADGPHRHRQACGDDGMTPSVAIVPALAIGVAWILWLVSWLAAAAWSRRTLARPGYARELPNRLVTVLGGVLLFMSLGSSRTYIPI